MMQKGECARGIGNAAGELLPEAKRGHADPPLRCTLLTLTREIGSV